MACQVRTVGLKCLKTGQKICSHEKSKSNPEVHAPMPNFQKYNNLFKAIMGVSKVFSDIFMQYVFY